MKKITLKSVKETFREKLLNEQEMDLLKGGDGYNTELKYPCTGRYVNGQATPPGDIFAFSSQEAQQEYLRILGMNSSMQVGYSFCIISPDQSEYGYEYLP